MNKKYTILIVDDKYENLQYLDKILRCEEYDIRATPNAMMALKASKLNAPDLILLDIKMPDIDGYELCRLLKKENELKEVPIIFISALDSIQDKIRAFEEGGVDYITKPFEAKELIARIKAVLRRSIKEDDKKTLTFPALRISLKEFEVVYNDKTLEMPPKELEILYFLASNPNTVFTREQLLEQVWGFDFFGDSRTVDVHIKRVREKLQNSEEFGWQIKTVWRVGYKFEYKPKEN